MVATKQRVAGSFWMRTKSADKMLPSLSERKRNAPFFHQCYSDLCKLRNIMPHPGIKARAGKHILDICGDRVKIDEWAPIMEALKHDRNLHFIAFRCKYPAKTVIEEADTEGKARAVTKRPVLLSKFILRLLIDSLGECLAESTSVTCLELDGLPLKLEYILIISKGISANTSLQTISLCNSPIGDEGCKQLCLLVRNMPSVFHLDMSNCDLSIESAAIVAETLKYQSLQRFAESWKQSLRYREPNIESMPGLRRIILNNNIQIGDEGVKHLTEVLKEDIWIRALDLQNCGISNIGAQSVLEILDFNSTLCIVDVRDNRAVDDVLVHRIMLKLFNNNANKDAHEYNWIIPRSQLSHTPSSQSLRSRQSATFMKRNSSVKSGSSVLLQSTNQNRTTSASTTKRDPLNDKKAPATLIIRLQKSQQSLKKGSGQISLKKKTESKYERLNSIDQENELLQKEGTEKGGFCIMKEDAYKAVFETLGRFSTFIEHIKERNKSIVEENVCTDDGDSNGEDNEPKTLFPVEEKDIALQGNDKTIVPLPGHSREASESSLMDSKIGDVSLRNDTHSRKKAFVDYDSITIKGKSYKSVIPKNESIKKCEINVTIPTDISSYSLASSHSDKDSSVGARSTVSSENFAISSSLSKVQELYERLVKVGSCGGGGGGGVGKDNIGKWYN